MAIVYFTVGDYDYSNDLDLYWESGGTDVTVTVNSSIRDTVKALSDIPSSVTYEGVTYRVRYVHGFFLASPGSSSRRLKGVFQGCSNLEQLPNLPETIDYQNLDALCSGCSSLVTVPEFPSGEVIRDLSLSFKDCTSLQAAPTIPTTVWQMLATFSGCASLQTPPSIPSAVSDMEYCFEGCTSLTSAPDIPASVRYMAETFKDCTSLAGNIVVNNTPARYQDIFSGAGDENSNIYIINGGNAGNVWHDTIAPAYSNVHYEADDHPGPALTSLTVKRVGSSGSTTPDNDGLWAYLMATVDISTELLPVGWTSELGTTVTTKDGTTITPTWTASGSTGTITLTAWVNINDLDAHSFTLSATELVKSGSTVKSTLTTTTLSVNLPKAYALVDYYHDPTQGIEGVSFGKFAEDAGLFDVALDALFRASFKLELPDYQVSGSVDKELYDAIVALGWENDVLE